MSKLSALHVYISLNLGTFLVDLNKTTQCKFATGNYLSFKMNVAFWIRIRNKRNSRLTLIRNFDNILDGSVD